MSGSYLLERAYVDGAVRDDVWVEIADGRFTTVLPGWSRPPEGGPGLAARPSDVAVSRLAGLTIPGLANCHSHAFHRALRGHTQRERGSFWTWREQMYGVAERLDPDSYYALARATYREMAASGITCVGEFHYLHHQPGGMPYDEPNAMANALVAAARDAGLRIALLDTCYLSSGFGAPPTTPQLRYSDVDAERWAARTTQLWSSVGHDDLVIGAAIHSVRAVPRDQIPVVAQWAEQHEAPLHVHLSEQVAENEACLERHQLTPTQLLAESGALSDRTSAVHATHLTDVDIGLLGDAASYACFCPTTERDLGDGIGPSRSLHGAGSALTLGSDSHAVIDLFEEMRAVETDERLATRQRGHWAAEELVAAATTAGHASLGFPDAGRIAVGQRADLVTLDTRSARTAGTGECVQTLVFAATSADVRQVIVGGRVVFTPDDLPGIGEELANAIAAVRA
ncbi:MAG: formimidoylglutamate deiminase [Marmoricola sp.]